MTDAMVEAVARAICTVGGDDPDNLCLFPDNSPKWMACVPDATAAIAAMQAHMEPMGCVSTAAGPREVYALPYTHLEKPHDH